MKALYTYLKLLYTNYKNQGIVSKVQLISLLQTSKTDLAMNFIDYERKKNCGIYIIINYSHLKRWYILQNRL